MPQKKASPKTTLDASSELRAKRRELLQQLTRQAEQRRLEVRQMLHQSAESREKEAADLRDSRFESLKKIAADVTQQRSDARAHLEQLAQEKSDRPAVAPTPARVAPHGPAPTSSQPPRRWQPGLWKPSQQPQAPTPAPKTTSKPTPAASDFSIAAIAPKSPVAPAPAPPTPAAISNAALDTRVVALEDRYSRLLSALQDQLDLTARWDELASRLETDFVNRIEQRISEESTRTAETLTANWQSDLAGVLDRLPSTASSPLASVALVDNLASQFQSFADEVVSRLAACEAFEARLAQLEAARPVAAPAATPENLNSRMGRIENGVKELMQSIENQAPATRPADPASPSQLLSNLSRMVTELKDAQAERQAAARHDSADTHTR